MPTSQKRASKIPLAPFSLMHPRDALLRGNALKWVRGEENSELFAPETSCNYLPLVRGNLP